MLADYTAFNQDSDSIWAGRQAGGPVGRPRRAADVSRHAGKDYKVSYLVAGEYKGFETDPERLVEV